MQIFHVYVFIWTRKYDEIFKSTLVYLWMWTTEKQREQFFIYLPKKAWDSDDSISVDVPEELSYIHNRA